MKEAAIIFATMHVQKFTPQQAFPKIKNYCAYQERCHSEVKERLFGYGLAKNDVEEMISKLVVDNYLNEERFAMQFAGGKFRIKQWGRTKIRYELRQKQVSEYCIKKALSLIDDSDYLETFHKLVILKLKSLKTERNIFIRKKKLQDFLRMKGYEPDLIKEAIKELGK